MRLVGPNCLGVLNTDPAVRLNATFAGLPMSPGAIGMVSQSGAFGIALLDAAARSGLGIGQFVSVGNKADVSGNDLLLRLGERPEIRVIAHVPRIVRGRASSPASRGACRRTKPIIVHQGRTLRSRSARRPVAHRGGGDRRTSSWTPCSADSRRAARRHHAGDARRGAGAQRPAAARRAAGGDHRQLRRSGHPGRGRRRGRRVAGRRADGGDPSAARAGRTAAASGQNPVDLGAAVTRDEVADALRVLLAADEVDAS